ncbi:MAG: hypothetical protein PWQ67_2647 [Clostridia bacterium]|jgi:hypothetical protein|nr:hypothetical protein [Clostridia bacterium]
MEKLLKGKEVITTFNASGAVRAATLGYVVLIVDIIDMSTSLEAALQKGAALVLGASPDVTKAPVKVNPYKIGFWGGTKSKELNTSIVILSEPRWGKKKERINNCSKVIEGIKDAGGKIEDIIPNLGAEVGKVTDFDKKIVICVSDTGGVAFDAAWQIHQEVTVGTIARTLTTKGKESAHLAAQRVVELANGKNIAVVAASSNSLEDILGANYITQTIIEMGYLNI